MKIHILSLMISGLIWFLPAGWAAAQTIVMIPGFQGQGMDWRFNQVTPMLQANGWVDGGNYTLTTSGVGASRLAAVQYSAISKPRP